MLCVQEHLEHRLPHRVHTRGLLGLLLEKCRPRHAHLLSQINITHLLDKREHAAARLHAPRSDVAYRRELLALAHGELRAGPGLEKDVLHLLSENHENFVMATGGGTPCFFNNIDYLKKQGTVVWINCSTDCLHKRLIKEKDKRPLIAHIADNELKSYIIKKYSSRKIFYQQANVILPEEIITIENLVDKIFHAKA